MAQPSASFSVTVRVELDDPRGIAEVTRVLAERGAVITALDTIESRAGHLVVDVTCNAVDEVHADELHKALDALEGTRVRAMSDRTLLLHLGGVLQVASKVPLRTRDDLSMAYTPGVARVSEAIRNDPAAARNLTIRRNAVAVVTDGSAVLGLGNIGPAAALPVMEGKAILFKRFADVDAWPLCLATQDPDEIVRAVEIIAPVFGGINLEDIAAPRCFEIERRLRERLDIPVFHDDQHGTAIVVLAALLNALRVVDKRLEDVRVVIVGLGAAGVAIARLLLAEGVRDLVAVDVDGIVTPDDPGLDPARREIAEASNPRQIRGDLLEAMEGADAVIGVSRRGVLKARHLERMAPRSVVFALANPEPEVDPEIARRYAEVVATGRSDEPNQINNVLVFPGFFRGLLDANAREITLAMERAAAHALAAIVAPEELSPAYIVPTVFNPRVAPAIAKAVAGAITGS